MSSPDPIILPSNGHAPDLGNGSVLFIGNATVLIRYAGFTILTDPTFVHMHEQVPIGMGLHTTRITNPAREIADRVSVLRDGKMQATVAASEVSRDDIVEMIVGRAITRSGSTVSSGSSNG